MGREVRRVPSNWKHPRDECGNYKPLFGRAYTIEAQEFLAKASANGLQDAVDYFGRAPNRDDYMPEWPEAERTHLMMYEDTSEGTPISPAFSTPEELARWLTDNNASAFGGMTGTYEGWLSVARGGWAPSMVMTVGADGNTMRSGVDAIAEQERK